jgi:glycosyltransferase involved in cell wall biosynthesis
MSDTPRGPSTIVVDLTPVRAGGENGGAKILALGLVSLLAELAPDSRFIVLSSQANHQELARLDAPNMRRFCVDEPAPGRGGLENLALRARSGLAAFLPPGALARAAAVFRRFQRAQGGPSLLQQLGADMLFCPFTAPFYDDGITPFVSTVVDLQSFYLPELFPTAERERRRREFAQVADHAAGIVCISEYVRETVTAAGAPPERTTVIYPSFHRRLEAASLADSPPATVAAWGLLPHRYLLYPANFWRHKNHAVLIDAFRLFRETAPGSELKLVLTGAGGTERDRVAQAAAAAGLASRVVFAGFVPDAQLSALLRFSLAMIFPSRFEGFGMPVLEAMAAGAPVLCSNVTSLPEIAGGAALLFDPQSPAAIAGAIARIESDGALREQLIQDGLRRAAAFSSPREMAQSYLDVLRTARRR